MDNKTTSQNSDKSAKIPIHLRFFGNYLMLHLHTVTPRKARLRQRLQIMQDLEYHD